MKDSSVSDYLRDLAPGSVFLISDVPTGTSRDSVKTQLSVACSKGMVQRVMRGIYYKPRYSETLGRWSTFGLDEVAKTIARANVWNIVPGGNMCMNLMGLSTQVPARCVYLSDGPYRKYDLGRRTIEFRHTSPRDLTRDEYSSVLVQAIKAKGNRNIDDSTLYELSIRIPNDRKQTILDNTLSVSPWIRRVIEKVCA